MSDLSKLQALTFEQIYIAVDVLPLDRETREPVPDYVTTAPRLFTEAGDTPASAGYKSVVMTGWKPTRRLTPAGTLLGPSTFNVASLVLSNRPPEKGQPGPLDAWLDLDWNDTPITVRAGGRTTAEGLPFPFASYEGIWTGVAEDLVVRPDGSIELVLVGRAKNLLDPVVTELYRGFGGAAQVDGGQRLQTPSLAAWDMPQATLKFFGVIQVLAGAVRLVAKGNDQYGVTVAADGRVGYVWDSVVTLSDFTITAGAPLYASMSYDSAGAVVVCAGRDGRDVEIVLTGQETPLAHVTSRLFVARVFGGGGLVDVWDAQAWAAVQDLDTQLEQIDMPRADPETDVLLGLREYWKFENEVGDVVTGVQGVADLTHTTTPLSWVSSLEGNDPVLRGGTLVGEAKPRVLGPALNVPLTPIDARDAAEGRIYQWALGASEDLSRVKAAGGPLFPDEIVNVNTNLAAGQAILPASDVSVGSWLTAPLWSKLNDDDDLTFAVLDPIASTAFDTAGTMEVALAAPAEVPGEGSYGFSFRIQSKTAPPSIDGELWARVLHQGEVIAERFYAQVSAASVVSFETVIENPEPDEGRFGSAAAVWSDGVDVEVLVAARAFFEGDKGIVYVYDESYVEIAQLTASDGVSGDQLGWDCSASGNYLAASTVLRDSNTGAVYIFERVAGTWGPNEIKILTASDGSPTDSFGAYVELVEAGGRAWVVVSTVDFGTDHGKVYIYERDEGGADNWGEVTAFQSASPTLDAEFGHGLGLSADGSLLIVAEPDAGVLSAHIYGRDKGGADAWGFIATLDGAAFGSRFGYHVAIDGTWAAVCQDHGNIYIYEETAPEVWTLDATLIPSGGGAAAQLYMKGSVIVAGGEDQSRAWLFEESGGAWSETTELTGHGADNGALLGFRVFFDPVSGLILASAPQYNTAQGSDYGACAVWSIPSTAPPWTAAVTIMEPLTPEESGPITDHAALSLRFLVRTTAGLPGVRINDAEMEVPLAANTGALSWDASAGELSVASGQASLHRFVPGQESPAVNGQLVTIANDVTYAGDYRVAAQSVTAGGVFVSGVSPDGKTMTLLDSKTGLAPVLPTGDLADGAELRTTEADRHFTYDLARSIVRTGRFAGSLTTDVIGELGAASGSTLSELFELLAGEPPGIDRLTFDPPLGVAFETGGRMTIKQALDQIAFSGAAGWVEDRQGVPQLTTITVPRESEEPVATLAGSPLRELGDEFVAPVVGRIKTIRPIKTKIPAWRLTTGYARNWTTHDRDALIGSLTDSDRERLMKSHLLAPRTVGGVKRAWPTSEPMDPLLTYLLTLQDAVEHLRLVVPLFAAKPRWYALEVVGLQLFTAEPGDPVWLQWPDPTFQLTVPVKARILALSEDSTTDTTTLEVFASDGIPEDRPTLSIEI